MLSEPCVNSRGDRDVLRSASDRCHRTGGQAVLTADPVGNWSREMQAGACKHNGQLYVWVYCYQLVCIQGNIWELHFFVLDITMGTIHASGVKSVSRSN